MNFYYFIWALLPFLYLAIILKAYVKRATRSHALEDEINYIKQFIFCLVLFFVAVFIDQRLDPDIFANSPLGELGDTDIFFWLIYPTTLLVGSFVVRFIPGGKYK